jgi:hypothetical protein
MGEDAIRAALLEENRQRYRPPLPDAEVARIAASVCRYPPGQQDQHGGQATRLVDLVLNSGAKLFHDQRQEAYAVVPLEGGRRIVQLASKNFQHWLSQQAFLSLRQACGKETLGAVTTTLAGLALFQRPQHDLHIRCAQVKDAIWLDLDGFRAVKITPGSWEVAAEPPILFRYFQHQGALPEPVRGGDIREVLKFMNISGKDDQLLLLCYLVAAMIPDVPVAALIVHGVHGAAKTTLLKIVKRLLDPSRVEVRGGVKDLGEFALAAWQNRALFFDNITSVPGWLSDALCRAVTGEGWSTRTYYTNEDSTVFEYQRIVGLAGINLVTGRPDLLDRALILRLDPLLPGQRRDEEGLWAQFAEARPRILGGILETLAKAMELLPGLNLPALPRLADFVRWGAAAAEAMGFGAKSFLEAYARNVCRQHQAAVEASLVAQAVLAFMAPRSEWEGTPAELLGNLNDVAQAAGIDTRSQYWPKDANWVTRRIFDVQPSLQAMGIDFHETRSGLCRTVVLRKHPGEAVTADIADTGPNKATEPGTPAAGLSSDDSDGHDGSRGTPAPPDKEDQGNADDEVTI